jgi:hypothetical protein
MTKLQYIISIFTFTTFCSCNKASTNKTVANQNDSIVSETANNPNQRSNEATFTNNEEEEEDTITTIKFDELSVSINHLWASLTE